ncbi:MAG: hypothetical protein OJF50_000715 [Nitrospira sp.]|nr:hypothetical protein [Nitrospira sp.]
MLILRVRVSLKREKNSARTHAATLAPRDMRAAATIRAVRPSRVWEDMVRD